ncbi:MAG: prolipoprotein diacylglyceryl transferase [Pseudomonadales bacterium]|jgi:phosphatidylglycerol:prolipoprotein diacylglycerol transferase|nr:prolipoprotein diacylglyceryl transferase [Pseudomonadales bacterium]
MLNFPQFDPVAISLGPLQIRWYALTYITGFAAAWWLGCRSADRPGSGWTRQQVGDLVTNAMLGTILGGRLGYILFYVLPLNPGRVFNDPLMILRLWEGGMSFHGGFLGVVIAVAWFARSAGKSVFEVLDFTTPLAPIGLGAGRLGNFINGELWGRPSGVSWAMVFPADPTHLPRHPSQLYQCVLEGVVLFSLLWWYSAAPRPRFAVSGMFLLGYGLARFGVEFVREPDREVGFIALNWLTMGQLLSLPMILAGLLILYLAYNNDAFRSRV